MQRKTFSLQTLLSSLNGKQQIKYEYFRLEDVMNVELYLRNYVRTTMNNTRIYEFFHQIKNIKEKKNKLNLEFYFYCKNMIGYVSAYVSIYV